MNALELADALQECCPYGLDDAARMLRQQQAEIEALKEFLDETCQIGKFIVWNSIKDKVQIETEWTDEQKKKLNEFLTEVFGWDKK